MPAVRGYFADGSIKYEEHFRYGWRHDAGDRPAIRKWRADGTVRSVRHYVDDLRVDDDGSGRRAQRRRGAAPRRSDVVASPGSRTKQ